MLQYLHLILLTVAGPFVMKSLEDMITPIPPLPTPIILLSMETWDGIPNRLKFQILLGEMGDEGIIQEGDSLLL